MLPRLLFWPVLGALSACSSLFGAGDDAEWRRAIARERGNPQIYSLEPGTLNVFEVEISRPSGWSQADEDAAAERAMLAKLRRLQEVLTAAGVDAGSPVEVPQPAPHGPQQLTTRVRFSVLHPRPVLLEEPLPGADCRPCSALAQKRGATVLRGFGFAPIDLRTVSEAQLREGVALQTRSSALSPADEESIPVPAPPEGEAVLRLVERCPATVVRVEQSVRVGSTSGVIAVGRHEKRVWYELRDATCAEAVHASRVDIGPTFEAGRVSRETTQRLWWLQAQGARLGVSP